ncbi:MAG: FumA C-terminus/TtdB family hydratase beta subunit [Lentisphaeria bacterium]
MKNIPSEAIEIPLPATKSDMKQLHVGDFVLLSGQLFTARDAVHKYLADGGNPPCKLQHAVIYHCGPVVVHSKNSVSITAAGPTTSIREEPYMADLIQRFGLRGIIGKGGMGQKTLEACARNDCVYLHAVGGAAQVLAERITNVENVFMEEQFGSPEALWELRVERLPVIVTMDSYGQSLHADTAARSKRALEKLVI